MHRHLTERQEQILRIIAADDAHCTVSMLAEALGVSSKTIVRELELCADYVQEYGIAIEKTSGYGLRLAGPAETIEPLCRRIRNRSGGYIGTPRQRQIMLKQELLRAKEPIKIYVLTQKLNVVESTISNDLDKLEQWFRQHELTLIRKQGWGVSLEGEETAKRNALVSLLYDTIDVQTRYRFIIEGQTGNRRESVEEALVLGSLDVELVGSLSHLMEDIEKKFSLRHEDNAFVSIVLHLLIVAMRVQEREYCDIHQNAKRVICGYSEYGIAQEIVRQMRDRLGLNLPDEEVFYVAMHLHGSKLAYSDASARAEQEHKTDLARKLLELAQQESQYVFRCDDELIENVANHIGPAINRCKLGLAIRNPLEEEIKRNYPQLFKLARLCAGLIEQAENIRMPDSEVAYLTMYLGAAIEKSASRQKRMYRIAICCPTGMSTSALLSARIAEAFDNVIVDQVVSLKYAQEALDISRLDLVVATLSFSLPDIDVLSVNPLLPARDQQRIADYLNEREPKNKIEIPVVARDWKERLTYLNRLSDAILMLLGNYFFAECSCRNKDELIERAAGEISSDNPEPIAEAFRLRESLGSVVLEEIGITLLHARSAAVENAYFGIIKIDLGGYAGEPITDTAVVMFAPSEAQDVVLDVMRQISVSIASDERFCDTIRRGNRNTVYQALEAMFKSFFNAECLK